MKKQAVSAVILTISLAASLLPWILFGFQGPNSDAMFLLECATAKFGLSAFDWDQLLFTAGPEILLTPLIFLFKSSFFFLLGSGLMAAASALCAWALYGLSRRHFRTWQALAFASLLTAFHPFVHQLHFYWMTELGFITTLILGIERFNRFLFQGRTRDLVWSAAILFLGRLMRPQMDLVFMLGAGCLIARGLWDGFRFKSAGYIRPLGTALTAFLLPAFLLSVPFRALNYHQYGTWLLSKTLGYGCGFYVDMERTYKRSNGPASELLWTRCEDILAHPDRYQRPEIPGHTLNNTINACHRLQSDSSMFYSTPRNITYTATLDWIKADDSVADIRNEAVRADPRHYLRWMFRHYHFYLSGLSENPVEWQDNYYHIVTERREHPYRFQLKDGVIETHAVGGLAYNHRWMFDVYNRMRTPFRHSMTYLKKITILLMPFLLWLVWKRRSGEYLGWIVSSLVCHLALMASLAGIVGFHHRYAAPFEFFTILYAAVWIDLLLAPAVTDRSNPV
jgi:hypothetical protein